MTGLRIATEDELRPSLDVLTTLQWPVPFTEVPSLFQQLGWEQQTRKIGKTTLPISFPLASFGALGDELSRVELRISDTFPEPTRSDKSFVKDAFPQAADMVSACLGFEPSGPLWAADSVRWELPTGGRVNLVNVDSCLVLQIWSKRTADIERTEIRQGIAPDQVFDTPE